MSDSSTKLVLDPEIARRITEASDRLEVAERELTLAMEAITLPDQDADNEIVGDRLRAALLELGAARRALAVERPDP